MVSLSFLLRLAPFECFRVKRRLTGKKFTTINERNKKKLRYSSVIINLLRIDWVTYIISKINIQINILSCITLSYVLLHLWWGWLVSRTTIDMAWQREGETKHYIRDTIRRRRDAINEQQQRLTRNPSRCWCLFSWMTMNVCISEYKC